MQGEEIKVIKSNFMHRYLDFRGFMMMPKPFPKIWEHAYNEVSAMVAHYVNCQICSGTVLFIINICESANHY